MNATEDEDAARHRQLQIEAYLRDFRACPLCAGTPESTDALNEHVKNHLTGPVDIDRIIP
jgi:hypothetical protein